MPAATLACFTSQNSCYMPESQIPIIGFAAWSGTGKTTLLIHLIRIFTCRQLQVAVIKHAHHTFEIDYPGKDSYELRKAGASQVLIGSRQRWALMVENPQDESPTLADLVGRLTPGKLDVILVEGFKPEAIPKIELHRPGLGRPLLFPEDDSIIAIASDKPLDTHTTLPMLDLNQAGDIAEFIISRFLTEDAQ